MIIVRPFEVVAASTTDNVSLPYVAEYDAIVVAACGFRRGGLGNRIDQVMLLMIGCTLMKLLRQILPSKDFGYGVGQGSIGIECRADDTEVQLSCNIQIKLYDSNNLLQDFEDASSN